MKLAQDIILRPVITEETMTGIAEKKYAFRVAKTATKPKTVKATVDFAAQIAEKQSTKETTAAEIASITANIDALKADLRTQQRLRR